MSASRRRSRSDSPPSSPPPPGSSPGRGGRRRPSRRVRPRRSSLPPADGAARPPGSLCMYEEGISCEGAGRAGGRAPHPAAGEEGLS
ncbi:hypothetical protein THAOC_27223, partial [Thalassiosira oceanica]